MTLAKRKDNYLTKRALKQATSKGIKAASKNAIDVADSVVIVKDGWVVRRFKDGNVDKISKLPKVRPDQIVLD